MVCVSNLILTTYQKKKKRDRKREKKDKIVQGFEVRKNKDINKYGKQGT